MVGSIAQIWQKINDQSIGSDHYWHIALQNESFFRNMSPMIQKYAKGKTLDIGAGRLIWRYLLPSPYFSTDLYLEHPDLSSLCDATQTLPFAAASFTTVFCCSVLEHVHQPGSSLDEMYRVLQPGGIVILSVPFVFYLHGQPHDYWRFTHYGAIYLAEKAGFEVEEVVADGGLFHLILNAPSILLSCFWSSFHMNALIPITTRFFLSIARFLDRLIDPQYLFAMNHILILYKKEAEKLS